MLYLQFGQMLTIVAFVAGTIALVKEVIWGDPGDIWLWIRAVIVLGFFAALYCVFWLLISMKMKKR